MISTLGLTVIYFSHMTLKNIVVDPNILAGHPIVKGTRIPVSLILNLISHGYTIEKVMDEYPELKASDIKAAISYAEERIKREEILPA
jgi:uncharacterized protein (DUF433 family)